MFRKRAAAAAADGAAPKAAAEPVEKKPVPWGAFLSNSAVWAIIVAHFCFNWGYYTLLAWLPSYFEMALGERRGRAPLPTGGYEGHALGRGRTGGATAARPAPHPSGRPCQPSVCAAFRPGAWLHVLWSDAMLPASPSQA